ncbi:Tropinone reductase-like 3 [Hibiscus syriacus]|uniref:Tropinone reductase-like 3 n=1 Tax=Hibiscus syriacus TaxID=106335 RepID=A0A6A2WLC8_HIBSY|nr:Tropinone reductase-like 3 [Hibiscus syriacus]
MAKKIGRRFEGKVAIVTASTQGIGFAIAERLGLEGASANRRQLLTCKRVRRLLLFPQLLVIIRSPAFATEVAPDTRVNAVAPGFVPTNFAAFITKDEAVWKVAEEKTLLHRLGTPEDMAAAAAFLASDDACYITGETIIVAGDPSRL